jgi:hypothetical protein
MFIIWPYLIGKFKLFSIGTSFKDTNLNMYLFHLLNFHYQEKHKRYGLSKSNIMNYNLDNNFLYGLWNGWITYDVLVRDLILIK